MEPMITLTTAETEFKQLDKDKASILWGLLGLTIAPEYDDFFDGTNPQYYASYSWDFCGFFYDVLLEKNTPCVVHFDWKWHPNDVFWQLKQNLPAYDIELLEAKDDPDYLAYEVSYRVGKNTAKIKVNFSEPNQLLNDISRWLPDKQFIDLNFGEDSYSWLIVPKIFDTERFLEITGLKRTDERASLPPQPSIDNNLDFGLMIVSDDSVDKRLGLEILLKTQPYTRRVMVGNSMGDYIGDDLVEQFAVANADADYKQKATTAKHPLTSGCIDVLNHLD